MMDFKVKVRLHDEQVTVIVIFSYSFNVVQLRKKFQNYANVSKVWPSMTIMQNMLRYAKVVKSICNQQKKSYIIQELGMLWMFKIK